MMLLQKYKSFCFIWQKPVLKISIKNKKSVARATLFYKYLIKNLES